MVSWCFMPKFRSVCIRQFPELSEEAVLICGFHNVRFSIPIDLTLLAPFVLGMGWRPRLEFHRFPHLFGWGVAPGNWFARPYCVRAVGVACHTETYLKPTGNPQRYQQVELGRRCSWWNLAVLVREPYSIGVAAQFPLVVPVHLALLNGDSDVQVLTICGRLGTGHPVKTIRCSLQHLGCACACGWPGLLDMLWAVASSNLSLGKTRTQPLQEWVWKMCIPPSFPM